MKKAQMEQILTQISGMLESFNEKETDEFDSETFTPLRASSHQRALEVSTSSRAFQFRSEKDPLSPAAREIHRLGRSFVCETDTKGHASPGGDRSPLEIVVDASEGFIPLWAFGRTLRWTFYEPSMAYFRDPNAAKDEIRNLFAEAVAAWGDAAPIRFSEYRDAYDFQIIVQPSDRCTTSGCTLASAFFPDGGRHNLYLYPKMFAQSRKEQVDTMIHELGHVFGLRHFFANVSETAWPSEVFGTHSRFSIMNYGELSELTETDRTDLKNLYELVWSGRLRAINGTPIRLVIPFHEAGTSFWS